MKGFYTYAIHVYAFVMYWSILKDGFSHKDQYNTDGIVRCHRAAISNYYVFLILRIVLILANSADPDEMQHNAAFHLGLHCLQKYP